MSSQDPLKIGLVSSEYPPETDFGGLGSYTFKLAHALADDGHQVSVISAGNGSEVTFKTDGPVGVYRVPSPRRNLLGLGRSINNVVYSGRVCRLTKQLAAEGKVQIFQFPEYRGESFVHSLWGDAPYVVRFSMPRWLVDEINRGTGRQMGPRSWLNGVIDRWCENTPVRRSRAFIFPSRDLMRVIEQRVGLKGLCRVVYPGVDAKRFTPGADPELRRSFGLTGGPVALFVGRLEFRKGVHLIAEGAARIAARVPNVRFAFVGSDTKSAPGGGGSMRAYMERVFQRDGLGAAVRFVGGIGHQDVARLYGLGDVLMVPSIYENLANVLLEGLASGLPIVTTSGGGSPEVVEDGRNGRVVPSGDAIALADATAEMLADSNVRAVFSQNNRRKALEDLSLERMAHETVNVYREVLAGARSTKDVTASR